MFCVSEAWWMFFVVDFCNSAMIEYRLSTGPAKSVHGELLGRAGQDIYVCWPGVNSAAYVARSKHKVSLERGDTVTQNSSHWSRSRNSRSSIAAARNASQTRKFQSGRFAMDCECVETKLEPVAVLHPVVPKCQRSFRY